MAEEQSNYDRAKKTQITLQLTDDTLEIARAVYERFRKSHLDGEDWSKQSFDEFIDDMVFFGSDQLIDSIKKYEQETASV
jgi:CO dehydrogenase/acetyl-CoA synthase delta subunit